MTTGLPPIDVATAAAPGTDQPRARASDQSFERLLDARRRNTTGAARTGVRRRSDTHRSPAPSGDDQARATRATARVVADQHRATGAAPIEPDAPPTDAATAVSVASAAQQIDVSASTDEAVTALAAPAQATATATAPITLANAQATEAGTPHDIAPPPLAANADGSAALTAGATTTDAVAPIQSGGADASGPMSTPLPPTSIAPTPTTTPSTTTTPASITATPLRPGVEAPPPLTDSVCDAPSTVRVAPAPPTGSTSSAGASPQPTPAPPAPNPDAATVVAVANGTSTDADAGDTASSDDAPRRGAGPAGAARPARRVDDAPAPPAHHADPQAPTASTTTTDPAPTGSTVPIARSESLARVLDAMTASDRPSAPLTRLAVELDDATRVAVRVHGQSVHVDVIADDAGRLDGAWRRDVAQGIKRHGLEYGRDGADANDGRGRRRDEPTPAIARDGGRRSRRFTIDLDTATPS